MGQPDKQPENFESGDLRTVEDLLSAMTESIEGIETLRHSLVSQFSQDIERLRQEKAELLEDVETLKLQRQEQMTQQQQAVSQIAPTLVNQLHELVRQHLNQLAASQRETAADSAVGERTETIYQRMVSLDATLRSTFQALQHDLSSYQSSISQQLSQMQRLEQQGEEILEILVNRLKAEIPSESSRFRHFSEAPPRPPLPLSEINESPENQNGRVMITYPIKPSLPDTLSAPESEPPTTRSQPQPVRKRLIGLLLVLLSLLALAFENVFVHIIFNSSPLVGVSAPVGGFLVPTVGNTLLILWLRMLVIVPLMAIFATGFYPFMWRDIQQFLRSQDWGLFAKLVGSGFLLFLSKVLIFLALGSLAPGVAVTVFFLYPIVLLLLGDRFNQLSSLLIFSSVIVGFVLATLPTSGGELSRVGVTVAAASGIAFALHLLLMQLSAKKLHPIPILWLNLTVVLIFSAFSLVIPWSASWSFEVDPSLWSSVIISGLLLGGITLFSYVLNYLGIAQLGAASASVLGATLPALTALLALILVQSTMQLWQILGMVFVTVGVAALGFERSRHPSQKKRSGQAG